MASSFSLAAEAQSLLQTYHSELLENIIPWWLKHSLDEEKGGYFTRLARDGQRYADDKDMWMVGREIWMFSHLYKRHERNPQWLHAAKLGCDFLLAHGFKPDGTMFFRLARDGTPISDVLSQYTEVFAAIALAQYSSATSDECIWNKAVDVYDRLLARLEKPEGTPFLGYPMRDQFLIHAKAMCRMTTAFVYHDISSQTRYRADLSAAADAVVKYHWKPHLNALLENVGTDGTPLLHYQEGRMFHPGHAIESAWMLMEIALMDNDSQRFNTAVDIILASLNHGWDKDFGGIRYITNFDWTPVHTLEADCKLWWPHAEALYALLLAWAYTGRQDLREWYWRIHEYTFGNFPDPEFGEWFGYLNRDGSPIWTAKANGWKGCFHAPRALFRCIELLNRITDHPSNITPL